jgi:hypothetical protein
MTNFFFTLRRLILPLFLLCGVNLSALNISAFTREADGEATVSFCGVFSIQNIALENKGLGPVLVLPKDLGGYKNLTVTSKVLDGQIKKCFADCNLQKSCAAPVSVKLKSAHLFKSKKGIVATLNLDGQIDAVFLVTKYRRDQKDIFKIKYPQDLKFSDTKLKEQIKELLTQEAKKLL